MKKPLFICHQDDEERCRTLMLRLPGDEDWFTWGEITEEQHVKLAEAGVYELTDAEDAPGKD